jgi:hypothetical protein
VQSRDRTVYPRRHIDSHRSNGCDENDVRRFGVDASRGSIALDARNAVDRAEITGDTLVLSKGSERLATMKR